MTKIYPITMEDLRRPNYINSAKPVRLTAVPEGSEDPAKDQFTIEMGMSNVLDSIVLSGDSALLIGGAGTGKSQWLWDTCWHIFGGNGVGGMCNYVMVRPDFKVSDLLERQVVDLNKRTYNSDDTRQAKEERVRRLFNVADEVNRAPGITQNEIMDMANGEWSRDGEIRPLGQEGYRPFFCAANFNRLNGDYEGTFTLDKALLSRAHFTIDLDHHAFRPTLDDDIELSIRRANPHVLQPEPRDISAKILEAYRQIQASSNTFDPYVVAFNLVVKNSLTHCTKDKFGEKLATFPMLCNAECPAPATQKALCSKIQGCEERTCQAVRGLGMAMAYLAEVKHGKPIILDVFEVMLQAYRLTTYHGCLNYVISREEYAERRQALMDDVIDTLRPRLGTIAPYIPAMVEGNGPFLIKYKPKVNGGNASEFSYVPKTPDILKTFKSTGIKYDEIALVDELKDQGLGTAWIDVLDSRLKKMLDDEAKEKAHAESVEKAKKAGKKP